MDRVLEIEMQDTNNETVKKSIPCVNPTAADNDLLDFVDLYVGLTTNTHVRTKKIDSAVLVRGE